MLEMIQGAYNGLKIALDTADGVIGLKKETDMARLPMPKGPKDRSALPT